MSKTIALVDDDRNILTSVSMALEEEGYEVLTYSDGSEALHAITKEEPDLAVLDIKMPRMDGLELLTHLRKKTEMPVIFLTSKDDEVDELTGLRMGADDYIKKPRPTIEEIESTLGNLSAGTRAQMGGDMTRLGGATTPRSPRKRKRSRKSE